MNIVNSTLVHYHAKSFPHSSRVILSMRRGCGPDYRDHTGAQSGPSTPIFSVICHGDGLSSSCQSFISMTVRECHQGRAPAKTSFARSGPFLTRLSEPFKGFILPDNYGVPFVSKLLFCDV